MYREPATKSNRTIILNAIEYVVFPGVVNQDTRNRVLDVIDRYNMLLLVVTIDQYYILLIAKQRNIVKL